MELNTVKSPSDKFILFYDGECAFCSFWVNFIWERDQNKVVFFAPLQGETAQNFISDTHRKQLDTVVFYYEGTLLTKSEAILTALKQIHYAPDLVFLLNLIPKKIRNFVYDIIARHRYKLFGKQPICPLPSEEFRQQLLK